MMNCLSIVAVCAFFISPSGNASVRAKAGPSEIVITTTKRLAGAVHSLKWNGKEFIDSVDHGRQLQSAASFDCGKRPFWAECYNPTEAGSRRDHVGPTSTSRLKMLSATENTLRTRSQMAFWLNPGEKSSGRPAINTRPLSNHELTKSIRIGYKGLAHAIEYNVTFTIPADERHTLAQFEALTGYMPPEFDQFWTFDPTTEALQPLTDGPGEQPLPVVFSTKDLQHAMGAIVIDPKRAGYQGPGFGRWRFVPEKVVKWNVVYRLHDPQAVPTGDHSFRVFVAVGSLENVRVTMSQLLKLTGEK